MALGIRGRAGIAAIVALGIAWGLLIIFVPQTATWLAYF